MYRKREFWPSLNRQMIKYPSPKLVQPFSSKSWLSLRFPKRKKLSPRFPNLKKLRGEDLWTPDSCWFVSGISAERFPNLKKLLRKSRGSKKLLRWSSKAKIWVIAKAKMAKINLDAVGIFGSAIREKMIYGNVYPGLDLTFSPEADVLAQRTTCAAPFMDTFLTASVLWVMVQISRPFFLTYFEFFMKNSLIMGRDC